MRDLIRRILAPAAIVGLLLSPFAALAGGVPLLPSTSQYSEPSQIVGTMNALINQLNGNTAANGGYAAAANGNVSLGTFCTATGATPQTCNGQRGSIAFTGLAGPLATGTVSTVVITNSAITTSSVCSANWISPFTAGSGVTVATATPTASTLTVISVNAGTTTNAVSAATLAFNCVN